MWPTTGVRYTREGRASKLVDCQAKMTDLDEAKSELETQKSRLIGTVDELRQELAAQKVFLHFRLDLMLPFMNFHGCC